VRIYFSLKIRGKGKESQIIILVSQSRGGRVIAYGCLIRRKEARREHLDYINKGAAE
jgi:hypothetical protein